MAGHFEPCENEKGTMQSGAKFLFFVLISKNIEHCLCVS